MSVLIGCNQNAKPCSFSFCNSIHKAAHIAQAVCPTQAHTAKPLDRQLHSKAAQPTSSRGNLVIGFEWLLHSLMGSIVSVVPAQDQCLVCGCFCCSCLWQRETNVCYFCCVCCGIRTCSIDQSRFRQACSSLSAQKTPMEMQQEFPTLRNASHQRPNALGDG